LRGGLTPRSLQAYQRGLRLGRCTLKPLALGPDWALDGLTAPLAERKLLLSLDSLR